MQKSVSLKLIANELRAEFCVVLHLMICFPFVLFHPTQWNILQAKLWLSKHIITAEGDLAVITAAIAECKAVTERTAIEMTMQAKVLVSSAPVEWMGK